MTKKENEIKDLKRKRIFSEYSIAITKDWENVFRSKYGFGIDDLEDENYDALEDDYDI